MLQGVQGAPGLLLEVHEVFSQKRYRGFQEVLGAFQGCSLGFQRVSGGFWGFLMGVPGDFRSVRGVLWSIPRVSGRFEVFQEASGIS